MATTTLDITVATDVAKAVDGFDDVGLAAKGMASDVDAATRDAASAAGRLDAVAGSADNLDDKAGKATGALGALSAGFELVGMEEYASGLQSASMATDFFSGVGQAASLVMESQAVQWVKNTALMVAHGVQSAALAAKTAVVTAAQWALNAALAANPIGLIILAVVALVALFVLLYKKNDDVREAVQAFAAVAQKVIGWVIDKVRDLVGWVRDELPPVWNKVRDKVSEVVGAIVGFVVDLKQNLDERWAAIKEAGREVWEAISTKVSDVRAAIVERIELLKQSIGERWDAIKQAGKDVWDAIVEKVGAIKDSLVIAVTALKNAVTPILDAILLPIRTAIGLVKDLIDWISSVKVPGWLSKLGGAVSGGVTGRAVTTPVAVTETTTNNYLTVSVTTTAPIDGATLLATLELEAARRGIRLGIVA